MKSVFFILLGLLVGSPAFAEEATYDTFINCHPQKASPDYRTFSFRLREVDGNQKMVRNSVSVANPQKTVANEHFTVLETNPNVETTSTEVKILSGDGTNQSAFNMSREKNGEVWKGRLQLWWPEQTSSYTTKIICFTGHVNSNSEPVIN